MNRLMCFRPASGLRFLTVAGALCALSAAALGQIDASNSAPSAPAKIVNPHRFTPGSGQESGPVPVGGICAAFNARTDCQESAFQIAYNITTFRTADAISARVPVSSICVQGFYANNTPVPDHWVLTIYNDGGGVPGTVLDTFTEGVDLVAHGPVPTGVVFVGRAVQEWNLVLSRPIDHHGACLWYELRDNAEGDSVFQLDGDSRISNGNLQAAQDFNQNGVYELDTEILPDDLNICINGGFADNFRCFNNPCEGLVPPNDECAGALALSVGPAPAFGSTSCAHADDEISCTGLFIAPSVWYSVTGTGHTMTVSLCSQNTLYDTAVEVYCGDCANHFCVAGNDDSCLLSSSASFCTTVGSQYLVLVHGFGNDRGDFAITLSDDGVPCSTAPTCGPCLGITCPAGAIPEAEPCGADTNGGCAPGSHGFEAIVGNATICGTVFANAQTRDSDWYTVTAPPSGRISATLTAGFTAFTDLVDLGTPPDPTCNTFGLHAEANVAACGNATLAATGLTPGNTYVIVVTSFGPAEFSCANYFLAVDQGGRGAPCCDFNDDHLVNSQDFFDFLSSFFTNSPIADFNGDHALNSQDFFDFITCFFAPPSGCP